VESDEAGSVATIIAIVASVYTSDDPGWIFDCFFLTKPTSALNLNDRVTVNI
jgi:hypothetical protein